MNENNSDQVFIIQIKLAGRQNESRHIPCFGWLAGWLAESVKHIALEARTTRLTKAKGRALFKGNQTSKGPFDAWLGLT